MIRSSGKSIAKPLLDLITNKKTGTIHSVFNRSCNLLIDEQLIGLVAPDFGNSPSNIVLSDWKNNFSLGDMVIVDRSKIFINPNFLIDLSFADIWDPEFSLKNWKIVAKNLKEIVRKQLDHRSFTIRDSESIIGLVPFSLRRENYSKSGNKISPFLQIVFDIILSFNKVGIANLPEPTINKQQQDEIEIKFAQKILPFLTELFSKNWSEKNLADSINNLIGLGYGLTPSGDDFLAGIIGVFNHFLKTNNNLELEIQTAVFNKEITFAINNSKTTSIACALLDNAMQGWFCEKVQKLLLVLGDESSDYFALQQAFDDVIMIGHNSGSDMIAGIYAAFIKLEKIN